MHDKLLLKLLEQENETLQNIGKEIAKNLRI